SHGKARRGRSVGSDPVGRRKATVGLCSHSLAKPRTSLFSMATSALDPRSQQKLMKLLVDREGMTLLSVGHRPELEPLHTRKILFAQTVEAHRWPTLGSGVGQARGVPCCPRYPSDPTISVNRCAIAAHRADTSENDSHCYVRCSDDGPPATSNAVRTERRLVGSDLEGDCSRAGRQRLPHRELQRSIHIGHIGGETFACWAPCWLMMQRACAGIGAIYISSGCLRKRGMASE